MRYFPANFVSIVSDDELEVVDGDSTLSTTPTNQRYAILKF